MNQIKATMGAMPAVVLSRFTAFASKHAALSTTLNLKEDGDDYIGVGRSEWEWTVDLGGARVSDRGSNFRLKLPELLGWDVALFSPCDPNRGFPEEAIEPVAVVKIGDKVVIQSRVTGSDEIGTVTGISYADYLVYTNRVAIDQESGSIVTTPDGRFVGFQSTRTGISVPNIPSMGPPPTTPPPTQPDVAAAVAAARAEERAMFRDMLLALAKQY